MRSGATLKSQGAAMEKPDLLGQVFIAHPQQDHNRHHSPEFHWRRSDEIVSSLALNPGHSAQLGPTLSKASSD